MRCTLLMRRMAPLAARFTRLFRSELMRGSFFMRSMTALLAISRCLFSSIEANPRLLVPLLLLSLPRPLLQSYHGIHDRRDFRVTRDLHACFHYRCFCHRYFYLYLKP